MIKYRVYDTEQKRYLNINNVSISGSGILRVVTYEDGYHTGISQLPDEDRPRFIVEQYTGLKDKNGEEIYVGDILGLYEIYIEEDETESEELEPWGEVVRTAAAMMVKSVRAGTLVDMVDGGEDSGEPMAGVEVMGNVHENSELLEEK